MRGYAQCATVNDPTEAHRDKSNPVHRALVHNVSSNANLDKYTMKVVEYWPFCEFYILFCLKEVTTALRVVKINIFLQKKPPSF